jgi:hypothetical protein
MSALGQKQTCRRVIVMSTLPPKADIDVRWLNARFVPIADIQGLPGTQRKLQPARRINQTRLDLNVA